MTRRVANRPDPVWVKPHIALAVAFAVSTLVAVVPSEADYRELWRTPKFVGSSVLGWGALAVALFVLGVLAGRGRASDAAGTSVAVRRGVPVDEFAGSRRGARIAMAMLTIACLSVVLWMLLAFQRGLTIAAVQEATSGTQGAPERNRALLSAPIWLAPFMHTSVFASGLAGIVLARGGRPRQDPLRLRLMIGYGVLVLLATGRSFIASERLALIEVLLPFAMMFALSSLWSPEFHRMKPRVKVAIRYLPVLAAIVGISIFAVFEVSRSWSFYASETDQSYADFIQARFAGYYATATNNSAMLERSGTPFVPTARTEEWLSIAVLNDIPQFFRTPRTVPLPSYLDLLDDQANPEFNNPGGFYTPFHDFGVVGGSLLWVGLGWAAGLAFRRARRMDLMGLLLYGQVILAISEVPRIPLFGEGRWLFPVAYVLILGNIESSRREKLRTSATKHTRTTSSRVKLPPSSSSSPVSVSVDE